MKYNIKEILDLDIDIDDKLVFIDYIDDLGNKHEYETINAEQLLDYITNLQETMFDYWKRFLRLNNQYDLMKKQLDKKQKVIDKAIEIYKSRIDKAIEYIEKREFVEVEIIDEPFNDDFDCKENLLNILKGSDK